MKTMHTPGPWVMRNTGTSVAVFGRNGTEQIHCERNTPQDEANARLIAAAPELLEACQLVRYIEDAHDQGNWDDMDWPSIIEQFRAAIAKATRSPSGDTQP